MLLRSVLPCSNNTNNTLGNGFHQNQSSLVTLTTNQRAVPQITNRAPANKVLFQTSPTAQVNTSNNNSNNAVHSTQQQGVHQHHNHHQQQQQQQPIHTPPQQIHPSMFCVF